MRIIGGAAGGRRLMAPRGKETRPTTDRVREAVASMLDARDAFADARVLDLFAGSGALALEALSRGAATALCVDRAASCQRVILANARALGYDARCRVIRSDVAPALVLLAREGSAFDLVFADPPYAEVDALWPLLTRLTDLALLDASTLVIAEHPRKATPPPTLGGLELTSRRCYGASAIALYRCSEATTAGRDRDAAPATADAESGRMTS